MALTYLYDCALQAGARKDRIPLETTARTYVAKEQARMHLTLSLTRTALILTGALAASLYAQAPESAPAKPDSPTVLAHIDKARQIAGKEWAAEATFFCTAPRANSPTDPVIEPEKIFDNLYALGRSGTV